MIFLVVGLTGQLGRGVVEAADGLGIGIVPVVRSVRGRSAARRVADLFPDRRDLAQAALDGDVAKPLWGLDRVAIERLAGRVDGVLDLAAETNWAASTRQLARVNHLGALHGLDVARALWHIDGRCGAYCYAGSVYAAGRATGSIPEAPFAADAPRTAYELSKWVGEQAVLDAAADDGPPVAVARIGGLLGNSRTLATAKRNSLYVLADDWLRRGSRVLPVATRGRVDMLPRDVAGRLVLQVARAAVRLAAREPLIAHVCAGESAPTFESVLATLRSLDRTGALARPRALPLPAGALAWASEQLPRLADLSPRVANTAIGLRYLALDRVFERGRLARLVGEPLPAPSVEALVRLAFELPAAPAAALSPNRSRLARFAA